MMVNPLARPWCKSALRRLGFEQRSETGLPKMMIRGKSIANAELAHDSETDAIGKGPL
jgi:hypothetical protein